MIELVLSDIYAVLIAGVAKGTLHMQVRERDLIRIAGNTLNSWFMLGGFPPMDCPCIDICWAICRVWSAAVCVCVCVWSLSMQAGKHHTYITNRCSVGPISVQWHYDFL